jgi:hypothetical protein
LKQPSSLLSNFKLHYKKLSRSCVFQLPDKKNLPT